MRTLWSAVEEPALSQFSAGECGEETKVYFPITGMFPPDLQLEEGGGMYLTKYTERGRLTHSTACTGAFGHYDPRCPRCVKLRDGARPRKSGHRSHQARKLEQLQPRLL